MSTHSIITLYGAYRISVYSKLLSFFDVATRTGHFTLYSNIIFEIYYYRVAATTQPF